MPFYKITHSQAYRRATVHHKGCNFRCVGCAYKIRNFPPVTVWPSLEEIKAALASLDVDRIHFMGGEPTTCSDLPELLRYCKRELGLSTFLGHTNGSNIPVTDLDGANVSFKAFSPDKHLEYTGTSAGPVYESFRRAFEAGLEMKASTVFIPGYIDTDEIKAIARYVASFSPEIPFHIMGYIPIPGTPWPRPTEQQMEEIVTVVKGILKDVGFSHLTVEEAQDLDKRDARFKVTQVL